MKFIHVADIHASRERLPQTLHILNSLTKRAEQGDINFILFAGDFWDSTITATKGSGFSDIVSAIRELERHTYLFFIYGTPTHEPNGSLDAFASPKTIIINKMIGYYYKELNTNIMFIPEPRRSNYVTSSAAETDKAINTEIYNKLTNTKNLNSAPVIVVYHGEVKGAVYQNGVSASSATAIPKELLQSLNADYYALGHIHMPQEVFPNAWYSGSACPKDFGEIHDGCYNLVTIDNGTTVERVSFNLPTYKTVQAKYSVTGLSYNPDGLENNHVRIQFSCTKEERKSLNIKQLQDNIKESAKAVSVKIEPEIIEYEGTKQSDVSKRKSVVEKMIEYAKEKSLKIPKYAEEILKNIQDNTLIKYAYPQHSFELLSLSLRGAIGIKNGQHKEDFDIDFEKFDDGVVCLCGNCGSGKTTLQENCHPYPCMLTRDGTLKDHFYLKDSHRILVYKDENGLYYKISMLIDGKTQSGKTSYFVETSKDRETWVSLPDIDGSLDSYKEWVNNTFGSIDIFLRTAFFAKEQTKNATDISDTTKGERMELLSKLAGTDHLKEVSVIAREQRKEIEKSAEKIESEIEIAADSESVIARNMADIENWKESLNEINSHIKETEEKLSELRAKDAEFQKVKAMSESYKALYAQYEKSFNEIQRDFYRFDDCVEHKETFDKVKSFKDKIETNTSLIASKNTELPEKKARINELTSAVIKLTDEKVDIVRKITEINSQMTLCKSQISDTNGVCPTCGSPLSEHKKEELELHNKKMQEEFDAYSKGKEKAELLKAENLRKTIEIEKARDQLYDEVKVIEDSVAALENESRECEQFIASCDEIYSSYSYEDALEKANTLRAQAQELDKKMDDIIYEDNTEDVSKKLAETEAELKLNTIKANNLTASVMAAEKENESCRKKLEAVSEKKGELKKLKDKIMAYNFIEDAFSNNGIPAIELRDSAPEISDIANKILKDSYGNRFEIRFGSTSELKAKRKANEDFNILVYDSENGDEKTIDLVSSGERIWIKQALFYAFSIVQMNRTGFNFRTRLIDESDGSLDGGLRPKYLQMVKSAHRYAVSRITILISHSQEIKDICEQKIEL